MASCGWLLSAHGVSFVDLEKILEEFDDTYDYEVTASQPDFGGAWVAGTREKDGESVREEFLTFIPINQQISSIQPLRAASQPEGSGSGTDFGASGGNGPPCLVGFQDASLFAPFHAFRWTQATGPIDLGTLDPPNDANRSSTALATTDDCTTVVGSSDTAGGATQHAFRWTQAGGMADLGAPAGAARASRAFDVSADGLVVVGEAEFADAAAFTGFRNGAYRWSGGSFQALGSLTEGYPSLATAISADAATIVGGASIAVGQTTTGQQAFRWTEAAGMVSLGALPGVTHSLATAVSDNGRIVAGTTSTLGVPLAHRGSLSFDRGDGAFRWTEATGLRDLRQLMIDAGVDMTGITLLSVKSVSGDGQWILGDATTPTTPPGETSAYLIQYCDGNIEGPCTTSGSGGASFTLGASSTSLAVAAGSSATTTLTLTPQASFGGPVSFACSGLPAGAACSFAPESVNISGAPVTTTLTVTTDGRPVALAVAGVATMAALVPLLLAPGAGRRRRQWARIGPAVAVSLAATACGGGSDDGPDPATTGTPAGTSIVTVTATSGSGASAASHALALTLTVTR